MIRRWGMAHDIFFHLFMPSPCPSSFPAKKQKDYFEIQYRRMMKKITIAVLGVIFIFFSIQGCNTVKGVGQDIEQAGEAIQNSTK